jgi:hypothetical protein
VSCILGLALLSSASRLVAADPKWISILPRGTKRFFAKKGSRSGRAKAISSVGAAADPAIERLSMRGLTPIAEYVDDGQWMYLLHHRPGFVPPEAEGAKIYTLTPETDLYLFPAGSKVELPRVAPYAAFRAFRASRCRRARRTPPTSYRRR